MKAPVFAARLAVWCAVGCSTQAGEPPSAPPALDYFVVVTGGELLEGAYPDGHTPFITRTLRPLGLRCLGSLVADDRRPDLLNALRFATNQAALVLVTGGLGPTPNDITRETLSEFTGIPLREEETVLTAMERRFGQSRERLRPNLRKQCLIPERGTHLANANGTAVGLVFEAAGHTVVALPGPPRELQPMVRAELAPWLQQRFGVHALGSSLTLRFVGVGQSQITQTLQEHVRLPEDLIVTSLFEGSRVDFTFTSPRNGPAEVVELERIARDVRAQLGEFLYADDGSTLEQVVLRAFRRRSARLAIAEVASGGALAASLSQAAEAKDVLAAAFYASSAERLARLVQIGPDAWGAAAPGESQVRLLAEATARHAGTEWAIAVGEAPATSGAAELWLAIHGGGDPVAHRLTGRWRVGPDGASLVTPILDRLRRLLHTGSEATPARGRS